MPGGAHFLSYFLLVVFDVVKTEIFAVLKVNRDPSIISRSIGSIEALYRFLQILLIRNYDFQSSTRDAPFGKCLTPGELRVKR